MATLAVRVQVPRAMKLTTPEPFTVHTPVVELVTVFVPSPFVETDGVNESPIFGDAGMLEIDGLVGVVPARKL
jgi:hypothetical protein